MQTPDETARYRDANKKTIQLALWTLAWATTLAAARFGPELIWNPQHAIVSWVAVVCNVFVGIAWIVGFTRFLRALDELQRKLMQDALAVTLGVGWVLGFAYFVADNADLVRYDLNLAVFPALLGVVFMLELLIGSIRYR